MLRTKFYFGFECLIGALCLFVMFYASINQALGDPIQLWNFEDNSIQANICPQNQSFGTFSIQTSVVHSGTYALRTNPTASNHGTVWFPGINTTTGVTGNANLGSDYWIRFYFRANTLPASGSDSIMFLTDSGTSLKNEVRINSTGNLIAVNSAQSVIATGSTALSAGQWYMIGFRGGSGVGAPYAIQINGNAELSGTMNQGAAAGYLVFGRSGGLAPSGNAVDFFYDDIIVDNAAFPGGGGGVILFPNANGSINQWTSGTGSSNYTSINTIPYSAGTYVQKSAGSSQTIMVNIEDATGKGIVTGSTINAVKLFGLGYNLNFASADAALATQLNCASANSTSSTAVDRTNDVFCHSLMVGQCAGTGAAFTASDLDSTQIGVIDTSSNASVRDLGSYLYVDFATPTPTPTPVGGNSSLLGVWP